MGLPFHRIGHAQAMQGLPFPDATQWDQIAGLSPVVSAIFDALEYRAAQSHFIYQDDTSVRIQDLIKENQSLGKADRRGMFRDEALIKVPGSIWIPGSYFDYLSKQANFGQ